MEINGTIAFVSLMVPQTTTFTACGSGSYDGPATFALTCNTPVQAPSKGTTYSGRVVLIDGFSKSFSGVFA